MSALRLGLAGCGRIAERAYLAAIDDLPGVELVAVADPDPGRAERLAAVAGAVAFADAGELLAAGGVEALVVATPAAHHEEVARLAADAGVPALIEKPPAPDLAGTLRLAALEPAPWIAFNRRFLQGAELAGAVPGEGWIELELELGYRRGAWAAHEARDDALLDAGVHLIDLAAFLAGAAPVCVRRAVLEPERASFELELARGRARIRCATDRRHRELVRIHDRAGRRLGQSRLGGLGGRLAALRGAPHPLVLSLRRQLGALAATLHEGAETPLAAARDGVSAMAAVEAARRSAELGGAEVTVAPAVGRAPGDTGRPLARARGGGS